MPAWLKFFILLWELYTLVYSQENVFSIFYQWTWSIHHFKLYQQQEECRICECFFHPNRYWSTVYTCKMVYLRTQINLLKRFILNNKKMFVWITPWNWQQKKNQFVLIGKKVEVSLWLFDIFERNRVFIFSWESWGSPPTECGLQWNW